MDLLIMQLAWNENGSVDVIPPPQRELELRELIVVPAMHVHVH